MLLSVGRLQHLPINSGDDKRIDAVYMCVHPTKCSGSDMLRTNTTGHIISKYQIIFNIKDNII